VRVVAVQAAGAAAFPESLLAGRPVPLAVMSTMADGIAIGRPGDVTFPLVRDLVDDVVTVDEEALSRALLHCLERAKLVVEPAGRPRSRRSCRTPARSSRRSSRSSPAATSTPCCSRRSCGTGSSPPGGSCPCAWRSRTGPGNLARLLAVLATTGGNVLDVEHSRTGRGLHVGEVEVSVQLETRGHPHGEEVLAALAAAGYRVTRD
jgi:threonine dehydratase